MPAEGIHIWQSLTTGGFHKHLIEDKRKFSWSIYCYIFIKVTRSFSPRGCGLLCEQSAHCNTCFHMTGGEVCSCSVRGQISHQGFGVPVLSWPLHELERKHGLLLVIGIQIFKSNELLVPAISRKLVLSTTAPIVSFSCVIAHVWSPQDSSLLPCRLFFLKRAWPWSQPWWLKMGWRR